MKPLVTATLAVSIVLSPLYAAAASDLNEIFARLESTRGLPLGILSKICYVESRCTADAKAKTSSATGMFQWLDGSWQHTTRLMNQGRPECPKGCPLKLEERLNPAIAADVTAFALAQMKTHIGGLIQQAGADMITGLYMGHFLGEGGARNFFSAYIQNPNQNAASLFPKAAAANGAVFSGRTLADVYSYFAQKLGQAPTTTSAPGSFKDTAGKLLVDNPAMYSRNSFDPTAAIPSSESELDYQTNYTTWTPPPPSHMTQQPSQSQSSPNYAPLQQPSYMAPPQYAQQYSNTGSALNNFFNLGTNSPAYTPIQNSVNYFENILGSSSRPTTSPFYLNNELTRTGALRGKNISSDTNTANNAPNIRAVDNTFDSSAQNVAINNTTTLKILTKLLEEVKLLLLKIISFVAG